MKQTTKKILDKEFNARNFRHAEDQEDIYEYIVHEAAESQISDFSNELQKELKQTILPFIQKIMAPQLEVRHVREEGLRIWGKADNVAFSKSTIISLLEMLRISNSSSQLETILFPAGRQASLGFFDQFRRILRVGNETRLPKSVISFLDILGEFDKRSGWWTQISYDDSIPETIDITILKPFWRFPYTQNDNHYFSDFAAGYILSLHNACYDYLSTISQVTDWKFFDWFAVEAKVFKDPDPDKCYLQLRRTKIAIEEFEDINAMICLLVEWLLDDAATDNHRDEIVKTLYQINDEIKAAFGEDAQLDRSKLEELQVNQHQYRPEFIRNELTRILQQVRCRYEDLRIAKLKS
jgi:hypothetical protein